MRFRPLDDLVAAGVLLRTRPDRTLVQRLLDRAERDIALARDVLLERDAERAVTVASEAGLRACLGALQFAGYRVRSGLGHHRTALEAAAAVVGDEFRIDLSLLNDAREFRNRSLDGEALPLGEAEVASILESAAKLVEELRAARRRSRSPRSSRDR